MRNDFVELGLNLAVPSCVEAGGSQVENQNFRRNISGESKITTKDMTPNKGGNLSRDEAVYLEQQLVSNIAGKSTSCTKFYTSARSAVGEESSKADEPSAMYGISLTVDSPIDYYEFDSLDLAEVFSNFGCCIAVEVSTDGKSATAVFSSYQAVLKAVTALSGLYVPVLNAPLSIRAFRLPDNVSQDNIMTSAPLSIVPLLNSQRFDSDHQSPYLIDLNQQDSNLTNQQIYGLGQRTDESDGADRLHKGYRQEVDNMSIPATAPVSPLAYQAHVDCYMSQSVYTKGGVDTSDRMIQKNRAPAINRGNYERTSEGVRKWTARYEIQIDADQHFQVTRRIIGNRGANMKKIFKLTGSKLRLRGRGSGYLEGVNQQEADDPLHLCISSKTENHYLATRKLVESLLLQVYEEHDHYRQSVLHMPPASLTIKFKETFLPARQTN